MGARVDDPRTAAEHSCVQSRGVTLAVLPPCAVVQAVVVVAVRNVSVVVGLVVSNWCPVLCVLLVPRSCDVQDVFCVVWVLRWWSLLVSVMVPEVGVWA